MTSSDLDMKRLPRHIGIIMDGNGRWAEQHGVSHAAGHEAGAKSVRAVVEGCRELGIQALSVYAFSTENWRRSKTEVTALFRLLRKYLHQELENIHKEDIRLSIMGRRDGLSKRVRDDLAAAEAYTAKNRSMAFNLAINYGARAEIADAAKAIAAEVKEGRLKVDDIDEECVARHLYQPQLSELDLLIRTAGEMRVSNFMLWQISYAELVVIPTLWPDFRKPHLHDAIREFQSRQRRFGGR